MESTTDLLRLPTAIESQCDRNYNYEGIRSFNDKLQYERTFDYENITHQDYEIQEMDKLPCCLSIGANPTLRIRRVEAEKNRIVRKRCYLEEGWTQVSAVLRSESSRLFNLPRGIRERIYEYLYTKDHPVRLELPDPDK